jgi:serine/tyrosine/threonine adenylyltransferase
LTFRRLCDAAADEKADANVRALFANPAAYDSWVARWRSRLIVERLEPDARAQAMRTFNPAFIPRNHRVEQALDAARL